MNNKRIFKTLPAVLAIIGLSAVLVTAVVGLLGGDDLKLLAVSGILALLFSLSELVLQKIHLNELHLFTARKKPFAIS